MGGLGGTGRRRYVCKGVKMAAAAGLCLAVWWSAATAVYADEAIKSVAVAVTSSVAANGDNGPQRLEVGHTDSFIVGRPKTLESIFTDTPAGITVDGYATDSLKPVAVIAHESAPIGGNPDESETVGKDIIDMIFGQAGFDVEVGHIVLAAHALSHSLSTGNRNRQYRQQQNDKMLHSTSTLII